MPAPGAATATAQKYLMINWQDDDLMVISGSDSQGVHGDLEEHRLTSNLYLTQSFIMDGRMRLV